MRGIMSGALLAASVTFGLVSAAAAQDAKEVLRSGNTYYTSVCGGPTVGYVARCHAKIVTDAKGNPLSTARGGRVAGFGPADLQSAYNITTSGSSTTTIAIVDAFGYDNAESDLQVYRTNFSLPTCNSSDGCFQKVNQKGKTTSYPAQNIGWAQESALDVDMASAMCPNCHIILVETDDNSLKNLAAGVDRGVKMGAHVVSNSYGGGEGRGETNFDVHYSHEGVAITASTGDSGFGAQYPATSPGVTAVGGTHLVRDSSTRGWTETAWHGAGSGCSKFEAKPVWQTDACKRRMEADVSAVADPATGVAVYGPNNSGVSAWLRFGGTSVAAPLVGGIYANNDGAVNAGSNPYAHTADLYDVVSGNNGTCKAGKNGKMSYYCTAGVGYDGPTGLGTPNGTAAFGD